MGIEIPIIGPAPPAPKVYHIRAGPPDVRSRYRFEWHPQAKQVYAIRLDAIRPVGDGIARNIETQGAAINAVLQWCRGYVTRDREIGLLQGDSQGTHHG